MLKCGACDEPVKEDEAVRGYLDADSILCRPCYEYLDNEVFSGDDYEYLGDYDEGG